MFDFVSIGSATQDVILICKGLEDISVPVDEVTTTKKECFYVGDKIDIESIHFSVGGGGTNSAYVFRSFGYKTALISKIGDDIVGRTILDFLKKAKIDRKYVVVDKILNTAYSTVMLTRWGDRTAFIYRGASRNMKLKDIPLRKIESHWIYITSLGGDLNILEKIISVAKRKSMKVAINPGKDELGAGVKQLLPIFRNIDVLILNRREAAMLAGEDKISDIKALFADIILTTTGYVVITDGARGAYAVYGVDGFDNNIYFVPSLAREVKDATGAGDTFGSSFVAGLYRENGDIEYALRLAALNAAQVVSEIGAKYGILKKIPTKETLSKIEVNKICGL